MSNPLGDDDIGSPSSFGLEPKYVQSLGRIGGKLLSDNLLRNGHDLAFETDLLYLKVAPIILPAASEDGDDGDPNYDSTLPAALAGTGVGINTDVPGWDFEVNSDIKTTNQQVTDTAYIADHILNNNRFTTSVGPINLYTTGTDSRFVFDKITTENITIDGNKIKNNATSFGNRNLLLDTSGSGRIVFRSTTNVTGDLDVSGDVDIGGNLSTVSNIILGDSPLDVITVNTDLTQDILPGNTGVLSLGAPGKRWAEAHIPDWTKIDFIIAEGSVVSDQTYIGGPLNQITTIQSNEDLFVSPGSGITFVEQIKIEGNNITNLIQTPALDPSLVAAGIQNFATGAGGLSSIWGDTVSGITQIVAGPGSVIIVPRTAQLGDIRDDVDNPNIVNTDDALLAFSTGTADSTVTNNNGLWYYQTIRPYIYADPILYEAYGNGQSLTNTPISIGSTGTGYYKFSGDTAFVIPAGTTAQREYLEIGETRWNTDLELLECFDGQTYIVSTGPGAVVTNELMVDLAIARALTFG